MSAHLIDGEFQSDKYPTTPRGKVPLSVKDPIAQDLLWEYAQRRRSVDVEFAADLETALRTAGYIPNVAICFECRPGPVTAVGRGPAAPPPRCVRCGYYCHGGHWVERESDVDDRREELEREAAAIGFEIDPE